MVAVGFNPRTGAVQRLFCVRALVRARLATPDLGVAETDIALRYGTIGFSRRYATKNACGDRQPWVETHGYHRNVATRQMAPGISRTKIAEIARRKGGEFRRFRAGQGGTRSRSQCRPTLRRTDNRRIVAAFPSLASHASPVVVAAYSPASRISGTCRCWPPRTTLIVACSPGRLLSIASRKSLAVFTGLPLTATIRSAADRSTV